MQAASEGKLLLRQASLRTKSLEVESHSPPRARMMSGRTKPYFGANEQKFGTNKQIGCLGQ